MPRGRIRVNAPVTFGAHELARVLPAYLDANPEVDVDLTLADRTVDLVDEGYDAVFRVGTLGDSGLIARAAASPGDGPVRGARLRRLARRAGDARRPARGTSASGSPTGPRATVGPSRGRTAS